ncbi:MAG TPA: hypothetical protein VFU47_10805, partial [Armatimonadota bacterium]|nr:hypothetical protein [Armatimonadota bacterium]
GKTFAVAGACLLVGIGASGAGLLLAPGATWGALLANFLFWTGLAQGGIAVAAAILLTRARWGRTVQRMALSLGAFLPLSLPLLAMLWLGRGFLYPEVAAAPRFLRNGLLLVVMIGVSLAFMARSLGPEPAPPADGSRDRVLLRRLAAGTTFGFFLSQAFLALDLILGMQPQFRSSILPIVYLAGSFYTALAATAILAALWRRQPEAAPLLPPRYLRDLGNLVWGFGLFLAYLWWCQYLALWMVNEPAEAAHLIQRWRSLPWAAPAWTALAFAVFVPGLLLLGPAVKRRAGVLAAASGFGAAGILLQRLVDVLPAVRADWSPLAGLLTLGVTLGFGGATALCTLWLAARVPPFPVQDAKLAEALAVREVEV